MSRPPALDFTVVGIDGSVSGGNSGGGVWESASATSRARVAAEDGEEDKPGEEKDEDIGGPNPRVHEPLRVLVHVHRRHRLHVEFRHPRRCAPPSPSFGPLSSGDCVTSE
ncbi:hypothetical protein BHM03_00056784 [Ensete ventricosum]|nr:hypothetical protein BHM03_00056784 [Ensete ventricosum]